VCERICHNVAIVMLVLFKNVIKFTSKSITNVMSTGGKKVQHTSKSHTARSHFIPKCQMKFDSIFKDLFFHCNSL